MICMIGSSFSRGAQGADGDDIDAYIHNMLAKELGCDVVNLSVPGHGSELYLENYVMASRKYKPRLFLAEIWLDRTFCNLWLPTQAAKRHADLPVHDLYENSFPLGRCDGQHYDYKDLWDYKLFRYEDVDQRHQMLFEQSPVIAHELTEVLEMYENISVYLKHESVLSLRTIKHLMSVEDAAQLVGIPVLWWTYSDMKMFTKFSASLPPDRHLNTWCGINVGTSRWAEGKLDGRHLADVCHLTAEADKMVVNELMSPFIRNHLR